MPAIMYVYVNCKNMRIRLLIVCVLSLACVLCFIVAGILRAIVPFKITF